jgi:TPP-dependent pyruvate/acetoin dehydrogenase alpha subunit
LLKREENDKEIRVLKLWCVVGMMINVVAKKGGAQKGEEGDTHKKVATRSFIGCSSILATAIAVL